MRSIAQSIVGALLLIVAIASGAMRVDAKTALRANSEISFDRVGTIATQPAKSHQQIGFNYGWTASDSTLAAEAASVSGGLCFAAGTLVETFEGKEPIEKLARGDLVLARNEVTDELEWKAVATKFVTDNQAVIELSVVREDGAFETLRVTGAPPVRTAHGWTAVRELSAGVWIRTEDSWVQVVRVEPLAVRETVYNIEVEDFHTYFVGNSGIWAHNACFPDPKQMQKIFNTTKEGWHREVLKDINKATREFAKKIGATNPDIGIDEAGNIVLKNVKTGKTIITDVAAESFKR